MLVCLLNIFQSFRKFDISQTGRSSERNFTAAAQESGASGSRGLGFALLEGPSWAGTDVPRGAFGHTGFTGTSIWCSPLHDVSVVLLSNRVHPNRSNRKITDVRRRVHDAVIKWLD